MFDQFLSSTKLQPHESVLDVGVTTERIYDWSNYLEAWYRFPDRITACGLDNASFLEQQYPGVRFVRANALALPFADQSFDVVHSSAVIEHVGNDAAQFQLISEIARVCRRAFFVTTPNRWFPIEVHTLLPLLHWLPKPIHRSVLRRLRYSEFAREETLNLLGAASLREFAGRLEGFDCRLDYESVLFWPSNWLLIGLRSFK